MTLPSQDRCIIRIYSYKKLNERKKIQKYKNDTYQVPERSIEKFIRAFRTVQGGVKVDEADHCFQYMTLFLIFFCSSLYRGSVFNYFFLYSIIQGSRLPTPYEKKKKMLSSNVTGYRNGKKRTRKYFPSSPWSVTLTIATGSGSSRWLQVSLKLLTASHLLNY